MNVSLDYEHLFVLANVSADGFLLNSFWHTASYFIRLSDLLFVQPRSISLDAVSSPKNLVALVGSCDTIPDIRARRAWL